MSTPAQDLKPAKTLTETLRSRLSKPVSNSDFDLRGTVDEVMNDVGLTSADSGGKVSFYGRDPIIASPHRFWRRNTLKGEIILSQTATRMKDPDKECP